MKASAGTATRRIPFSLAVLTVLLILAAQGPAMGASAESAGTQAGGARIQDSLTADLAASWNPAGAMLTLGGYRKWIQETDEQGTPTRYVMTGASIGVNPAYAKGSVYAEWGPVVFATARVEYDRFSFFGANGGLLSFPDADADYGDQALEDLKGDEETGTGDRALFQPTLYGMIGPVIVMNQTDLTYYRFHGGEGPYFLDWEYEILVRSGDKVFANRTQFLIPAWKGTGQALLYTGPCYEIVHAHDGDLTRQRVGWFEYWVPYDRHWGVDRPRLYSLWAYDIQDPNRKGQGYFAIGAGFDFDVK